jgi:rhamnosyltransferase
MKPRVCVLLAAFNGRQWIEAQVESILAQSDVDVSILASDDGSTDGTREWLADKSELEPRVRLLPSTQLSGSSARNFERLIKLVDLDAYDLLAFSDQDDLWLPGKLQRGVDQLRITGADGYSSNVTALSPSGQQTLIPKAQPQRRFDHYFESASAGSTFVLSMPLARALQEYLRSEHEATDQPRRSFAFHDWFIYCFARCSGFCWHIDPQPFVLYRQHAGNEVGANIGMRAMVTRIQKLRAGWYLDEVRWLCAVMEPLAVASAVPALQSSDACVQGLTNRVRFVLVVGEGARRRNRDRWFLGLGVLLGMVK